MRLKGSSRLAAVLLTMVVGLGLGGCTEDPSLDRVGGSGSPADGQARCDETPADASPRPFPCDVEAVLRAKCQRCHNSPAVLDRCYPAKTCLHGPFPLLTWSDTHQVYAEKPIFVRMREAVASGYMPFQSNDITPPTAPLEPGEKETLVAWTTACAPPGNAVCGSRDAGSVPAEAAPDVRDK